ARATLAHYTERTAHESARPLKDIAPRHGYDPDELSRPDKFADPYMGKAYGDTRSHELLSMSMQLLYDNPGDFFDKDPQSWEYVIKLLQPDLSRPAVVLPPPDPQRLALEREQMEQETERLAKQEEERQAAW